LVLTAWALAGVAGPTIYDVVKEKTGSLDSTLVVFAGLFVMALIVSILMKITVVKAYKKMDKEAEIAGL
jgi:OFA family oxalate/formate antiporter-like MFS transporter